MIKAVIFDMGGVIVRTEDMSPRQQLSEQVGRPLKELDELVFASESSHAAEVGMRSMVQHWQWVGEQLGLDGPALADFSTRWWQGDRVDVELVDFIRSLRGPYKTALLSNAWDESRALIRQIYDFSDAFDLLIFSAEVGLRKPGAPIFQLLLNQLGVNPQEAVFVDDFPANITGAQAVGLHTVHFRTAEQARQDLMALLNGK